MNPLSSLLKFPLRTALKSQRLRTILSYELEQIQEIEVGIPLSHGFTCPLVGRSAVYSFTEIFLLNEYGNFLSHLPMPSRWIDFGCHAGYFSLYLAWQRKMLNAAGECHACLIDADPRMVRGVETLLRSNHLESQWLFLKGAVGDPSQSHCEFQIRHGMASSLEKSPDATTVRIPILTPEAILQQFAPPYDMIKIDIEGAETALFQFYGSVLAQTRHLILEWHQAQGASRLQFDQTLAELGFQHRHVLREPRPAMIDDKTIYAGTDLYEARRGPVPS